MNQYLFGNFSIAQNYNNSANTSNSSVNHGSNKVENRIKYATYYQMH